MVNEIYGKRIEMRLTKVSLDPATKTPVALLREVDGPRTLPLWIGPLEAMCISLAQSDTPRPLPLTHALLLRIMNTLHSRLLAVEITDIREGILCASLVLDSEGTVVHVECRPADALALAVQAIAPIYVYVQVLQDVENIRSHAIPEEKQDVLLTASGIPLRREKTAVPVIPANSAEGHGKEEQFWSDLLRRMNPVSLRKN